MTNLPKRTRAQYQAAVRKGHETRRRNKLAKMREASLAMQRALERPTLWQRIRAWWGR